MIPQFHFASLPVLPPNGPNGTYVVAEPDQTPQDKAYAHGTATHVMVRIDQIVAMTRGNPLGSDAGATPLAWQTSGTRLMLVGGHVVWTCLPLEAARVELQEHLDSLQRVCRQELVQLAKLIQTTSR